MKSLNMLFVLLFLTAQVAYSETIVFSKSGYQTQEVAAVAGDTNISVSLVAAGWPDASNTGPTGTLTASGPITVTQNGAVIQSLNVSGSIIIRANNVTVRNCTFGSLQVESWGAYTGTVVEDCILGWAGVKNFTLRRCEMSSEYDDLVRVSGPNVIIEYCYLHVDGPPPETGDPHTDVIQEYPVGSGTNLIVRYNTLYNALPQTSIVIGATDMLFEGNLAAGGGYTLYASSGQRVINNHFSTISYPYCGRWNVKTGTPGQWTGNVWHETGLPCN